MFTWFIRWSAMMTSSNGNIFRVTGHSCVEFTGQWRGALMFSLLWSIINGWVNNRDAGDLRRHRAHHDVTVMVVWEGGTFVLTNTVLNWVAEVVSHPNSFRRFHAVFAKYDIWQNYNFKQKFQILHKMSDICQTRMFRKDCTPNDDR